MPHIRKDEAPIMLDEPEVEGRFAELDDYTVSFQRYHVDADPAPLFRGLPDDRCQCQHWGLVLSGSITIRYADREETYSAGDAFYIRPGHLPRTTGGSEIVEFTPTVQLQQTMAVLTANLQAGVGVS